MERRSRPHASVAEQSRRELYTARLIAPVSLCVALDHLVEEFAPVPRDGYSDSQSPRAHRETTNEAEAFAKGEVNDSARSAQRVSPENVGANKVESDLSIESVNERAYPRRK
jgi:hypothetical protein